MRANFLLVTLLLCPFASAQHVIWEIVGPPGPSSTGGDSGFPAWFDAGKDVDGDGIGDVVAGSPPFGTGSEFKGKVLVYSGIDGAVIHEVVGPWENATIGGRNLLTGDLDGDGLSEFATAAYQSYTFVYSGADASELQRLVPPESWWFTTWDPLAVLHVDDDGIPDLALGCAYCEPDVVGFPLYGAGAVAAVSGADGSVFWTYPGNGWLDRLGWSLANVGDLDGDGVDDLLAGAPGFEKEIVVEQAHDSYAELISGATGQRLARIEHVPPWEPLTPNRRFGWSVDGGDFDLDGVSELLVGQPIMEQHLSLYSGADGSLLHQSSGDEGYAVRFLGDADGDGFSDYLGCDRGDTTFCYGPTGGYLGGCGTCTVFSGEDHAVIMILRRVDAATFGTFAASAGDVDGDDFPDVAISDEEWHFPGTSDFLGRLTMMSLTPEGVSTLGEGCPGYQGEVPRIGVRGSPVLGGEVTLFLSQAAPGVPAMLGIGTAELLPPLDLAVSGLPGCLLHVQVTATFTTTTEAGQPVPGRAAFGPLLIPDDASLLGTPFFAQWWVDGGGGFPASVTRALRFDPFAGPPDPPDLGLGTSPLEARPALSGISPGSVPAFGATPVTLSGSGFLGAKQVQVGSLALAPLLGFTVVDDATITFSAPQPVALGTVQVTVVGAAGKSNPLELTYLATEPPKLTGTGFAVSGQTLHWNFGSLPDHAWLLLVQINDPSTIPLAGYEILGAPPILLASGMLDAVGIGSTSFPLPSGLGGSSVYSQVVVQDGALAFVAASNIFVSTILF